MDKKYSRLKINLKSNIAYIYTFAMLFFFNAIILAQNIDMIDSKEKKSNLSPNYQKTLENYLQQSEPEATNFKLIGESQDSKSKVTKMQYAFISQTWPKSPNSKEQTKWQHKVNIYLPTKITSETALLWINGGTVYQDPTKNYTPKAYNLNFEQIADRNNCLVIDLQNIPNQYLKLDNKSLAEDALVAHTWAKFMNNPVDNQYSSAYLPMVKAVIKAMDNIQSLKNNKEIKELNKEIKINNFIISGLSKRGMATWLASLQDDRVKAIIPVSIDILNTKANILHIFKSHQDWPVAMSDYSEHKVLQNLNLPESKHLMEINDPYQYIYCYDCDNKTRNQYQKRASIDKYIILASGDDFFVPDSTLFYYDHLPGNKQLRFIPNSGHFINNNIVNDILLTYIYLNNHKQQNSARIIKSSLKRKFFSFNKYNFSFSTTIKPSAITLYTAQNHNKRDFRLSEGVKYEATTIPLANITPKFVKKDNSYKYTIEVDKPKKGWKAYFIELEYDFDQKLTENNIPIFKLTTPVNILPRNYPELIKASLKNKAEAVMRYGNSVIYPIKEKLRKQ